MITENAYAKINLFLDILSKRENGYHNLLSYMLSLSLCDKLTFSYEPSDKIEIELKIEGNNQLSNGQENIVYKTAQKFLSESNINAKVIITLEKVIPMQAGLGGGSADAGATLRGLNRLFKYPLSKYQLLDLSQTLGADVPFCLIGGAKTVTGIGETLHRMPMPKKIPFVIVQGKDGIDTKNAYSDLDKKYDNFAIKRQEKSENIRSISEALYLKKDIDFQSVLYNIFEETETCKTNKTENTKKTLLELGAKGTLLSGSGSAIFGIFYDERKADKAVETMISNGYQAFKCYPVGECGNLG